MKKSMKELIALTEAQSVVIKKMYELYVKAQDMGICFAVNENSNLVAYNGLEIEDCDGGGIFPNETPEGFEYADMEQMREVFPVWDCDELYLKRK
jgi:hypothetical protein